MNYILKAILKKKKKKLNYKKLQPGFSIIELMIVLALIGLLGAFMVPNLFKSKQKAEAKIFCNALESLIKDATIRSIITGQTHQIYIDFVHQIIQTRIYDQDSIETNIHKKFKRLLSKNYITQIPVQNRSDQYFNLKNFIFKNFYINGIQELQPGTTPLDLWFYIMPDGTCQPIIANIVHQDDDGIKADMTLSFIINPFYARMSVYDQFQTP